MNKEEAEKLIKEYDLASSYLNAAVFNTYECRMSKREAMRLHSITKKKLLAALTQEPNQPKGPGRYNVTMEVNVEECKKGCKSCESRLFVPDMTLGVWMDNSFDDESGACVGDITGHWQLINHALDKK